MAETCDGSPLPPEFGNGRGRMGKPNDPTPQSRGGGRGKGWKQSSSIQRLRSEIYRAAHSLDVEDGFILVHERDSVRLFDGEQPIIMDRPANQKAPPTGWHDRTKSMTSCRMGRTTSSTKTAGRVWHHRGTLGATRVSRWRADIPDAVVIKSNVCLLVRIKGGEGDLFVCSKDRRTHFHDRFMTRRTLAGPHLLQYLRCIRSIGDTPRLSRSRSSRSGRRGARWRFSCRLSCRCRGPGG